MLPHKLELEIKTLPKRISVKAVLSALHQCDVSLLVVGQHCFCCCAWFLKCSHKSHQKNLTFPKVCCTSTHVYSAVKCAAQLSG